MEARSVVQGVTGIIAANYFSTFDHIGQMLKDNHSFRMVVSAGFAKRRCLEEYRFASLF